MIANTKFDQDFFKFVDVNRLNEMSSAELNDFAHKVDLHSPYIWTHGLFYCSAPKDRISTVLTAVCFKIFPLSVLKSLPRYNLS